MSQLQIYVLLNSLPGDCWASGKALLGCLPDLTCTSLYKGLTALVKFGLIEKQLHFNGVKGVFFYRVARLGPGRIYVNDAGQLGRLCGRGGDGGG